ncbi:hypothetical protein OIN82_01665 [Acinetobacter baumannii]|nr:hypothetical protein [Acinetobacter baumannii]MDC5630350.1 hypothetical protein [Acinetobacter baumannii]
MDKCREEFEAIARELDLDCEWVDLTGTTVLYGSNGQKKDGCYNDFTTDTAWNFYKEQQAKVEEQAQEIANLKSLIQGHELRHQQNLSIKQKLTRRSEGLQKRVDAALEKLDQRHDELWGRWKEQADMQDQGAANAFEEAYWILEQTLKGEGNA